LDREQQTQSATPMRIGVDLGGTKIEVAALGADGQYLARRRAPTPNTYDAAIDTIRLLINEVEASTGARGTVGVGAPGSISPATGLVRNANTVWLNGRAPALDLETALSRPVRLANDANCMALSEAVDGAAAGARTAFAVILGTGCGGGLVVDGRLVEGANGVGGEWGHLPLPWATEDEVDAPVCWCGRRGCLETWISGSGLRRDFQARTGRALKGEEIVAAAQAGDIQAEEALDRLFDRLGRGLAMICDILDPDVFVFAGGLSKVQALYQRLPGLIAPHVFSDLWSARLVPAHWGDASGVRGAAMLWPLPEDCVATPKPAIPEPASTPA
jgi:fructokinase